MNYVEEFKKCTTLEQLVNFRKKCAEEEDTSELQADASPEKKAKLWYEANWFKRLAENRIQFLTEKGYALDKITELHDAPDTKKGEKR